MSIRQCALTREQISRYGRHLILEEFGSEAQTAVCRAKVLVIGAGGLGAPVLLYLAGAGVGELGIVDGDFVSESNLHRQILHSDSGAEKALNKAESAAAACIALNPLIRVHAFPHHFSVECALGIAKEYDVLVDCTDNVPTRYLISDVGVRLNKPIVSGAALRMEGQLSVYNFGGGPCYRCLFPEPPRREFVTDCSDGGVLGPVPGIVGSMQATEVLKVIAGKGDVLSQKMLVMDAMDWKIRVLKLRPKREDCLACSKKIDFETSEIDYVQFCGAPMHDQPSVSEPSSSVYSISCEDYVKRSSEPHILLDVREPVQFSICSLASATNIPISQISSRVNEVRTLAKSKPVYVMCRRGIFSAKACLILKEAGLLDVVNIAGGYEAYCRSVDSSFPLY